MTPATWAHGVHERWKGIPGGRRRRDLHNCHSRVNTLWDCMFQGLVMSNVNIIRSIIPHALGDGGMIKLPLGRHSGIALPSRPSGTRSSPQDTDTRLARSMEDQG